MRPTKWQLLRVHLIAIVLIALLGALAFRCFQIQVLQHGRMSRLARSQHTVRVKLPARRGVIYDRNAVALGVSVQVYSAWVDPELVHESVRETVASRVASILHLPRSRVLEKLSKPGRFAWLKRRLSNVETELIRSAELPGVFLQRESQRHYPHGRLACHIIGFTDVDSNGLEGMEAVYDHVLRGIDGSRLLHRDGRSRRFLAPDSVVTPPTDGCDLHLTIDANIQLIAQEELDKAFEKHKPVGASALVMDARSGEILALANLPDYDLNRPADAGAAHRRNRAVTDIYEPGSSFKPIVCSAALEKGIVAQETRFFCGNGAMRFGRRTLHDCHPYGLLTVREIIVKSSNIGMAQVGFKCGKQLLHEKISRFGFGRPTGIELPGEVAGILRPVEAWNDNYSISSISMGQEVGCNCVQMVRAFSVFANGGFLLQPRVVLGVETHTGEIRHPKQESFVRTRILPEQVCRQMLDMMVGVVNEGTAKRAKMDGYQVAGKTGTSQKLNPNGGYSHSAFVGSFVGIVPAGAPILVVAVVLDEPHRGGHYGGTVAAPAVREIAWRSLAYLGVPPKVELASADSVQGKPN